MEREKQAKNDAAAQAQRLWQENVNRWAESPERRASSSRAREWSNTLSYSCDDHPAMWIVTSDGSVQRVYTRDYGKKEKIAILSGIRHIYHTGYSDAWLLDEKNTARKFKGGDTVHHVLQMEGRDDRFAMLLEDGTVKLTNEKPWQTEGLGRWNQSKDLAVIDFDGDTLTGVDKNGRGRALMENRFQMLMDVAGEWTDLEQLVAGRWDGYPALYGLKKDGTVVYAVQKGFGSSKVKKSRLAGEWYGIGHLFAGERMVGLNRRGFLCSLRADGKLVGLCETKDGMSPLDQEHEAVAVQMQGDLVMCITPEGRGEYVLGPSRERWLSDARFFEGIASEPDWPAARALRRKQNEEIDRTRKEIAALFDEKMQLKGLFAGKRRKELDERLSALQDRMDELNKVYQEG